MFVCVIVCRFGNTKVKPYLNVPFIAPHEAQWNPTCKLFWLPILWLTSFGNEYQRIFIRIINYIIRSSKRNVLNDLCPILNHILYII